MLITQQTQLNKFFHNNDHNDKTTANDRAPSGSRIVTCCKTLSSFPTHASRQTIPASNSNACAPKQFVIFVIDNRWYCMHSQLAFAAMNGDKMAMWPLAKFLWYLLIKVHDLPTFE